MAPYHAAWPVHRPFCCDCRGFADSWANVSAASDVATLLMTLSSALAVPSAPNGRTCPCTWLNDFARFMGGQVTSPHRTQELSAMVKSLGPCFQREQMQTQRCMVMRARGIMSASVLLTETSQLEQCRGPGVEYVVDAVSSCKRHQGILEPTHAHFSLFHPGAYARSRGVRGKWTSGARAAQILRPNGTGLFMDVSLEGPGGQFENGALDPCSIELAQLSPTLTRLHSGVLAESAAVIALGLVAQCADLPKWLSFGSWKQTNKAQPLPCGNLSQVMFERLRHDTDSVAVIYTHLEPRLRAGNAGSYFERVRPEYLEMMSEEFGVHKPPLKLATLEDSLGWKDATHPCCQHFVMQKRSWSALAKMHVLLIVRQYLRPSPSLQQHMCWTFEGLPKRLSDKSEAAIDVRQKAVLPYILESGSILFLYATHQLIPAVQNNASMHFVAQHHENMPKSIRVKLREHELLDFFAASRGATQICHATLGHYKAPQHTHPSFHAQRHLLYGTFNLRNIETAYSTYVLKFALFPRKRNESADKQQQDRRQDRVGDSGLSAWMQGWRRSHPPFAAGSL